MTPRWPPEAHFGLFWALVANDSQMVSGGSFRAVLGSGGKIAPRWPLEAHFGLFWALVAKLLSNGFWGLILSCSVLWWQNCSQMASGCSFWAVLVFRWQHDSQMASGSSF